MPTGYTSSIYEGKEVSVKDFISTCARAFGAYIMVRDEPLDKKVPDEFQPSTYNKEQLEKAKLRMQKLKSMTHEEIKSKVEEEYHQKVESNKKYYHEKLQLRNRYLDMLVKVKEWQPPTPDHVNLKEFCIKQLEESLKWDCGSLEDYNPENVVKDTPEEQLNKQIESCLWEIEYHAKQWDEEVKRTNERNLWIKQLKESLENFE